MGKYLIEDLEPQKLFHYFEDLCKIPRVTYHEKEVADYLVDFAQRHQLLYYRDSMDNVIIRKAGSRGFEQEPPVLLEGHTDIVGEKSNTSSHNFLTDPIELIREGNILHANQTTLGADNGCAVAMMLTLLEDDTLVHPPLECFFAVQEEVGMFGAKGIDISQIKARRAIGLDAGSEGVFRKGTSTKYEMTSAMEVRRESAQGSCWKLTVEGLRGGDQGANIPLERICAIKMTARVLHYCLKAGLDIRVSHIEKVGKSIPSDCTTYLMLASGEAEQMQKIMSEQQNLIRLEYAESDPDILIHAEPAELPMAPLVKGDSDRLINFLYLIPYGVRNKNHHALDEAVCSVIMKKIWTDEREIHVFTCISTEKLENGLALQEEMETFVKTFGWNVSDFAVNRGWDWEPVSPIRKTMADAYRELYGHDPKINISHGGNDCVVLKQRIPDLDVVTTAATYLDYHTPKERLYLDSFVKVYRLLERTLEKLCLCK